MALGQSADQFEGGVCVECVRSLALSLVYTFASLSNCGERACVRMSESSVSSLLEQLVKSTCTVPRRTYEPYAMSTQAQPAPYTHPPDSSDHHDAIPSAATPQQALAQAATDTGMGSAAQSPVMQARAGQHDTQQHAQFHQQAQAQAQAGDNSPRFDDEATAAASPAAGGAGGQAGQQQYTGYSVRLTHPHTRSLDDAR